MTNNDTENEQDSADEKSPAANPPHPTDTSQPYYVSWDPNQSLPTVETIDIKAAKAFLDSWITTQHVLRRSGRLDAELATFHFLARHNP